MCTVTILPEPLLAANRSPADRLGLRLACNRDELLTRRAALPPRVHRVESHLAIMPVDPDSGGTWIGANDAGLVCALLNQYDGSITRTAAQSRGTVIPTLLGCATIDAALARIESLTADRFLPFRLLITDGHELAEICSDGHELGHRVQPLRDVVMRTSSGLGDHLVRGPREELFRRFLAGASNPIAASDLFHLHRWQGREEISVRMRRHDARTVSHTVVELREHTVTMTYRPAEAPDGIVVTMAA